MGRHPQEVPARAPEFPRTRATLEYTALVLAGEDTETIAKRLNDMSAEGWELVTLDRGMFVLQRDRR